jgi:hypothetical protein
MGFSVHSQRVDSPYVPGPQMPQQKAAYMPSIQKPASPTYCPKSPVYKQED